MNIEETGAKVKYKAVRSKFNNCVCNGCFKRSYVTKITYPESCYWDGKNVTTRYGEWWLCDDCIENLSHAVHDAKTED